MKALKRTTKLLFLKELHQFRLIIVFFMLRQEDEKNFMLRKEAKNAFFYKYSGKMQNNSLRSLKIHDSISLCLYKQRLFKTTSLTAVTHRRDRWWTRMADGISSTFCLSSNIGVTTGSNLDETGVGGWDGATFSWLLYRFCTSSASYRVPVKPRSLSCW